MFVWLRVQGFERLVNSKTINLQSSSKELVQQELTWLKFPKFSVSSIWHSTRAASALPSCFETSGPGWLTSPSARYASSRNWYRCFEKSFFEKKPFFIFAADDAAK
jgi:hypothetical protein